MAYEETSVPVSRSQENVRRLIYSHRGTGLMLISKPPMEGFEALITIQETALHIRVMARCKKRDTDRQNEQELRRTWRVLFFHLKAMFEAADSGVIDFRDVIMPYVVLRDGRTLSDTIKPRIAELMTMNPSRLLAAENG